MISTAEVTNHNNFTISCINGERSPAQVELDIKRDESIFGLLKKNFIVNKSKNKEVIARNFAHLEHIGIFYCESPPVEKITMINNLGRGGYRLHTMTRPTPWLNYLCSFAFNLNTKSCLDNHRVYLCFFQQILSQLILHWLLTEERQFTSACSSYTIPKIEMWRGSTMVNQHKMEAGNLMKKREEFQFCLLIITIYLHIFNSDLVFLCLF